MKRFATVEDSKAIESEMPWEERDVPRTLYQLLSDTAQQHGGRNAISFQLLSKPGARAETLTWSELAPTHDPGREPVPVSGYR